MNYIGNELLLNQTGFEFNDDFDKVISFTHEVNDIISKDNKYISTKEILFCGFLYTSTLYFKDKKLKEITLSPVLRRYLSNDEFQKHDASAAFRFSEIVIKDLTKKYSKVEQNKYEILFTDGNRKIRLIYGRDYDDFNIEVENYDVDTLIKK